MMLKKEKNLLILTLKEEIDIDELAIKEYLNKEEVNVVGHYFPYKKDLNFKEIYSQIDLARDIHKILMKCRFNGLSRIESRIGREIEGYKVQLKRINRDYNELIMKINKNDIDKLLIFEGKKMISQGSLAIESINDNNYFSIIERSMNRREICLGRVDGGNLRIRSEKMEIGLLRGISYNLIEEDIYKYIKKIQRRNAILEEDEIIDYFVHGSHLAYSSINYLKALCTYPKDFFKNWERYRQANNTKTYEEYVREFDRTMKYELKKI